MHQVVDIKPFYEPELTRNQAVRNACLAPGVESVACSPTSQFCRSYQAAQLMASHGQQSQEVLGTKNGEQERSGRSVDR
jgi:hypothetical protein